MSHSKCSISDITQILKGHHVKNDGIMGYPHRTELKIEVGKIIDNSLRASK